MRTTPFLITLLAALGATAAAGASPRSTWRKYITAVGRGDRPDILACYTPELRRKISSNQLRLERHAEEMYGILCRDYRVRAAGTRRAGDAIIMTVRFRGKKDRGVEFGREVLFERDDGEGRWLISKYPAPPAPEKSYWRRRIESFGPGTYVVTGAGILLVGFLLRKLLTHS